MIKISRLFLVIGLSLFIAATAGCFRAVKYQVGGKSYLSRTEAEEARSNILEKNLSTCQLANRQVEGKFILVSPTRKWIKENSIMTRGLGPKADLMDFLITGVQRDIETEYKMIIKSGVLESCKIVEAISGNGESEHLALAGTYEIRVVTVGNRKKDLKRSYFIYSPDKQGSKLVGAGDIYYSSFYGWDWFADQIQKFVSK